MDLVIAAEIPAVSLLADNLVF